MMNRAEHESRGGCYLLPRLASLQEITRSRMLPRILFHITYQYERHRLHDDEGTVDL